jgi:hypothetical protein
VLLFFRIGVGLLIIITWNEGVSKDRVELDAFRIGVLAPLYDVLVHDKTQLNEALDETDKLIVIDPVVVVQDAEEGFVADVMGLGGTWCDH